MKQKMADEEEAKQVVEEVEGEGEGEDDEEQEDLADVIGIHMPNDSDKDDDGDVSDYELNDGQHELLVRVIKEYGDVCAASGNSLSIHS